jgi:hypothetical protein
LITARSVLAGAGTQSAGLAAGGGSMTTCTEEYSTNVIIRDIIL